MTTFQHKMEKNSSKNIKSIRKSYTFEQKREVLTFYYKNKTSNQDSLALKFGMPKGTINEIIKNPHKYQSVRLSEVGKNRKRATTSKSKVIYNDLYSWILKKRSKNHIVTNQLLTDMALEIAKVKGLESFKASTTWIIAFKKEYGIHSKTISGDEGLVNPILLQTSFVEAEKILKKYESKNIFNCDETALFWKCPPAKTLLMKDEKKASGRIPKERITLHLCSSITGKKIKPLIIGKYESPRGFKNINFNHLELEYTHSVNAWMTGDIFRKWLNKLDSKMIVENRKILLILDNAPVHCVDHTCKNVELLFLPPNCTSKIQPLDQGIIRSFKAQYRTILMRDLNTLHDDNDQDFEETKKKLKLKDILPIIVNAWKNVTKETIVNCSNHAFKNWSSNVTPENNNRTPLNKDEPLSDNEKSVEKIEEITETGEVPTDFDKIFIDELKRDVESETAKTTDSEREESNIGLADAFYHLKVVEQYFLQISSTEGLNNIEKLKVLLAKTSKKKGALTDYFRKIKKDK